MRTWFYVACAGVLGLLFVGSLRVPGLSDRSVTLISNLGQLAAVAAASVLCWIASRSDERHPRAWRWLSLGVGAWAVGQVVWTYYELTGSVGPIPIEDREGSVEVDETNWDAIVGVKGRAYLGSDRRWFVPYYFDIGAGESKLTYQAMGGVGYSFGRWDLFAAWRYLDYEFKSGSKVEELNFSGPGVAVQFRW